MTLRPKMATGLAAGAGQRVIGGRRTNVVAAPAHASEHGRVAAAHERPLGPSAGQMRLGFRCKSIVVFRNRDTRPADQSC